MRYYLYSLNFELMDFARIFAKYILRPVNFTNECKIELMKLTDLTNYTVLHTILNFSFTIKIVIKLKIRSTYAVALQIPPLLKPFTTLLASTKKEYGKKLLTFNSKHFFCQMRPPKNSFNSLFGLILFKRLIYCSHTQAQSIASV